MVKQALIIYLFRYMIDRGSAEKVSPRIQDLLFAMAVSNSCMNPLVYGSYTIDLKGALRRLLKNTCCRSTSASDTIGETNRICVPIASTCVRRLWMPCEVQKTDIWTLFAPFTEKNIVLLKPWSHLNYSCEIHAG